MTLRRTLRCAALLGAFLVPGATRAQANGMVRHGDRVLLSVAGDAALTDTFTVSATLNVSLPSIGEVSLRDVPRASVKEHFARVLSKYIRNPEVDARVLILVGVVGEVARPGYYAVPTDFVVADVIMVAGGPTKEAKVGDMRLERNGARIMGGSEIRDAMTTGATIGQLSISAGDQITVPRERTMDAEAVVRILAMGVTIPAVIYGFTRRP